MDNISLEEDGKLEELEALVAERDKRMAKQFAEEYQTLVKSYGYQIVGIPQFVSTRSGTFEIAVSLAVDKVRQ